VLIAICGVGISQAQKQLFADLDDVPITDVYLNGDVHGCDFNSAKGYPTEGTDWGWTRVVDELHKVREDKCVCRSYMDDDDDYGTCSETRGYILQKLVQGKPKFYFIDADCNRAKETELVSGLQVKKTPFDDFMRMCYFFIVIAGIATLVCILFICMEFPPCNRYANDCI
jgi:hypothetical protein